MSDFVLGQRWVVDAEPELGLGVVVELDGRAVTLAFTQAECERMYARSKAPLTRITFEPGDELQLADGSSHQVRAIHEHNGLMLYDVGDDQLVPETALHSEIKMDQPFLRLMTGQLDKPRFFAFRRALDAAMASLWQSRLAGLIGHRASLIDHQLYVAWSACERAHVRVLLADEVGLGKTLEAGLILSRLLRTERAERALILVPDALVVQWLVELIRRFNIRPDVYTGPEHDFAMGSVQLVPHSVLAAEALPESLFEQDLVIVDEAHRLAPGDIEFNHLEALACVDHLVLLTATPEQLGVQNHFARLQLLDAARFDDFDRFVQMEDTYVALNDKIKNLSENRAQLIAEYKLDEGSDEQLLNQLLDSHGTGRVMFRNTRASVTGFPERIAHGHELADDSSDAKLEWLAAFLKQNPEEKVLAIAHHIDTVRDAETYLWQRHGIDVAVFHEQMDLIERDRAAAYFADTEMGCQVLICSEIGSEGRNFQFSHHLVCLDLPEHPDVLEQRIGRLDRIGQSLDVNVHVPFGPGSETERRFHWYHTVLQCIDRQSPAAGAVHDAFRTQFEAGDEVAIEDEARARREALELAIAQGRDALLERNSCRQPQAAELSERIAEFEQTTPLALVEAASDLLHFHFEETHFQVYSLIPADNMLIPSLPGIPPEGVEVTFNREVANSREDVQFLSWDAPFIVGLWELLHHSDLGSASVALLPSKQLPAGQCIIEACFDLVVQAGNRTQCLPFLNELSLRTLVLDVSDKDLSEALPEDALSKAITKVDKKLARKIIESRKEQIPGWYHKAEEFTGAKKATLAESACDKAGQWFDQEISRLEKLADRNPTISEQDVTELRRQREAVLDTLQNKVQLKLSAIRLIVTTEP